MSDDSLVQLLKSIGLHCTAQTLPDLIATATKQRFSARTLIERMATAEDADRKAKSLERRSRRSRVGHLAPMADYDWNWPKKIDRVAVEEALALDFIATNSNVVLLGAQGLGKTMIAQNIAHNAVLKGHSALFITAAQLLNDLAAQESSRALERKLRFYCQSLSVLCIDEIGYLSYENRAADLLYEVISRRHKKKSLVITTNLAFSDWPTVFPNASCAVAMIDRLIEHSSIIAIEGDSFRKRVAEQRLKTNKPRKSK
jgi:DNA replication protein DnaC